MMIRRENRISTNCKDFADIPAILTIPECASAVHVAPITIRRAIWTGELKARKIGRIYRIPKTELLRWAGIQE